jgi:hypothetical protein
MLVEFCLATLHGIIFISLKIELFVAMLWEPQISHDMMMMICFTGLDWICMRERFVTTEKPVSWNQQSPKSNP